MIVVLCTESFNSDCQQIKPVSTKRKQQSPSPQNSNHPRLKTTITLASKQQSPSPQNNNHLRIKTTITLASNQQSPSPQIHIEHKNTTTHDDGHFAWDCTKPLRPEPVNGIPIISPLIKGSPTAIQIYKYKSKIQVQIRFASTHKDNTITQTLTTAPPWTVQ